MADRPRLFDGAYWAFVAVILTFGYLTGFSIGIPFLLLGATLVCVAPFRKRRELFWPPVGAVLGLIAGFMLTAPFMCMVGETATSQRVIEEYAACKSVIGITYSLSGELDRPSFTPAFIAAGTTAAAAGLLTRFMVSRLSARSRERESS